jgi:hypothetical protein
MTATDPTSRSPQTTPDEGTPEPVSPAAGRAARFTYANMFRSLLPLVAICLVIVGWNAFRAGPDEDAVREIDPSSTISIAAERAAYPLVVPTGLGEDYRPTSARTNAVDAGEGSPITLEIGYVTPSTEFAGFVVSDDPRADAVRRVLDGAEDEGSVQIGGTAWTRSTTERGETAFSRVQDGVTVVVSGSASDAELEAVAAAVRPYTG